MIVDSHQHVFWHNRNDADLVADMDAHGIDVAWLLTWEIAPDEMHPTFYRALNPEHRRPDGTHAAFRFPTCSGVATAIPIASCRATARTPVLAMPRPCSRPRCACMARSWTRCPWSPQRAMPSCRGMHFAWFRTTPRTLNRSSTSCHRRSYDSHVDFFAFGITDPVCHRTPNAMESKMHHRRMGQRRPAIGALGPSRAAGHHRPGRPRWPANWADFAAATA